VAPQLLDARRIVDGAMVEVEETTSVLQAKEFGRASLLF
jgi:hypothetical protein